jgi:hypothetical protein
MARNIGVIWTIIAYRVLFVSDDGIAVFGPQSLDVRKSNARIDEGFVSSCIFYLLITE